MILYLPAAIIPFYIYNKVYTLRRCTLFAYIGVWECYGRSVYILSLAWAGFTLLILYIGAMREPDSRDRRGEIHYSHVFFVSIIYADCGVLINQTSDISLQTSNVNVNGQQGSAGQAPLCVPLLSAKITKINL